MAHGCPTAISLPYPVGGARQTRRAAHSPTQPCVARHVPPLGRTPLRTAPRPHTPLQVTRGDRGELRIYLRDEPLESSISADEAE